MSASSGEAVEIGEIDIMVRVEDCKIRDVERGTTSARAAEDWDGDYLLPGLISADRPRNPVIPPANHDAESGQRKDAWDR